MNKIASILLLLSVFFSASVKGIDAYFDFKIFHVPGQGPMVETHLNFFGESLNYQSVENGEQASVEITMIFFDGDSEKLE